MLVLTLNKDGKIDIGNNITITFLQITGPDRIRIGFEAPTDVPIIRQNAKCKERKENVPNQ